MKISQFLSFYLGGALLLVSMTFLSCGEGERDNPLFKAVVNEEIKNFKKINNNQSESKGDLKYMIDVINEAVKNGDLPDTSKENVTLPGIVNGSELLELVETLSPELYPEALSYISEGEEYTLNLEEMNETLGNDLSAGESEIEDSSLINENGNLTISIEDYVGVSENLKFWGWSDPFNWAWKKKIKLSPFYWLSKVVIKTTKKAYSTKMDETWCTVIFGSANYNACNKIVGFAVQYVYGGSTLDMALKNMLSSISGNWYYDWVISAYEDSLGSPQNIAKWIINGTCAGVSYSATKLACEEEF